MKITFTANEQDTKKNLYEYLKHLFHHKQIKGTTITFDKETKSNNQSDITMSIDFN